MEVKGGETSNRSYEPFTELVSEFKNLTEVQQERWNIRNKWKHLVAGKGTVSEVEDADIFSEIQGNYYEVTVELEDGNRAVIFYPRTRKYNWVGDLQKDSQQWVAVRLPACLRMSTLSCCIPDYPYVSSIIK
ncbi:MAG: hypothetical protein M1381_09265 [Deltaproteobacteria bacterium]|nr:hypothetical protein [Deltaproteobacteria bacterium]